MEITLTLLKATALIQLSRRPGLSAVENMKCNQEPHQKSSCAVIKRGPVPSVIAAGAPTYHKCRRGVVACKTASIAPPLSRNQTLCSSSKICITETRELIPLVPSQQGESGIVQLKVKLCSLTCLQVFPASDVINIPELADNSGPIFPEKRSNHFPRVNVHVSSFSTQGCVHRLVQSERLLHIIGFRGRICSDLIWIPATFLQTISVCILRATLPVATMMPGTVFLLVTGPEVYGFSDISRCR